MIPVLINDELALFYIYLKHLLKYLHQKGLKMKIFIKYF